MATSDNRSVTSEREALRLYASGETTINVNTATPISDPDSLLYPYYGEYTVTHSQGEVVLARAWADLSKNGRLCNSYARYPSLRRVTTRGTTTTSVVRVLSDTSLTAVPIYYKVYKPR